MKNQNLVNASISHTYNSFVKKQKGITLIALIITIIVLLILAGVTIGLVVGDNSVLNKAQKAKGETEKGDIIESIKLDILNWQIAEENEVRTVTCNWIANNGDKKNITDSSSWGNHENTDVKSSDGNTVIKAKNKHTQLETGKTTFTMANNIYDFAGNFYEWTQEASNTDGRGNRGGNSYKDDSDRPVTNRVSSYPDGLYADTTTRPTLILAP